MKRTVFMLPVSDVYYDARVSVDPGSSPYWWTNTPSISMAAALGDGGAGAGVGACDFGAATVTVGGCNWVYFWPDKDAGGSGLFAVKYEQPPTLALFTRLKFHWWGDYSQGGPNNWYFPGDNAHGPRQQLVIRNRAGTGYIALGTVWEFGYDGATGSPTTGNHNCKGYQGGCGAGYEGPVHCSYEMVSHPEGGPWTLDDMINLVAGVQCSAAAPAYDNSAGSFFKIRVLHMYLELDVLDLGGFVANVRNATSLDARLTRRSRNTATIMVPDLYADRELFGVFQASHPRGNAIGADGWGERPLDRRGLQLLARTYWPESLRVQEEGFDLRDYQCLAWGVFRIDTAWTPELTGMCYLDQGGGFEETRDQDGWSSRPGDGVLLRVLEDYPILSREGLACQGGDDVSISKRNYDPGLASWSQASFTGDTTSNADTTLTMVDELGYQSSRRLTFGGAGGTGGFTQSLGTVPAAGGNLLHVRAAARTISAGLGDFMEYALIRTGTRAAIPFTEYFDFASGLWTAVVTYNAIPSDVAYGEIVADCVPCDDGLADAPPAYSHRIGRFSSAISNAEFIVGVTDVQLGGAPNGASYGARTTLVTLDVDLTRVATGFEIDNQDAAKRSWLVDRGMVVAEFRPFFKSSTMPDGTVKPIMTARHSANDIDRIDFVRSAGANIIRFSRVWLAGTKTVEVAIPDVDRSHVVRVWARWLDDEGWHEYAPRSMQVGWARFDYAPEPSAEVFVDSGNALGENQAGTVATTQWIRPGWDDAGNYLDGWLRMYEVRQSPLHEVEAVWRR